MTSKSYTAGYELGKSEAAWCFDGNTTQQTYQHALTGLAEGDPEVMDEYAPRAILSGEFAGESISELSTRYGVRLTNQRCADLFEQGYCDGWFAEVEATARYHVGG